MKRERSGDVWVPLRQTNSVAAASERFSWTPNVIPLAQQVEVNTTAVHLLLSTCRIRKPVLLTYLHDETVKEKLEPGHLSRGMDTATAQKTLHHRDRDKPLSEVGETDDELIIRINFENILENRSPDNAQPDESSYASDIDKLVKRSMKTIIWRNAMSKENLDQEEAAARIFDTTKAMLSIFTIVLSSGTSIVETLINRDLTYLLSAPVEIPALLGIVNLFISDMALLSPDDHPVVGNYKKYLRSENNFLDRTMRGITPYYFVSNLVIPWIILSQETEPLFRKK